jgi:hypothetical protein
LSSFLVTQKRAAVLGAEDEVNDDVCERLGHAGYAPL